MTGEYAAPGAISRQLTPLRRCHPALGLSPSSTTAADRQLEGEGTTDGDAGADTAGEPERAGDVAPLAPGDPLVPGDPLAAGDADATGLGVGMGASAPPCPSSNAFMKMNRKTPTASSTKAWETRSWIRTACSDGVGAVAG